MPVYKDERDGQWRWRRVIRYWDGRKVRERGTPQINTKEAALADEQRAIREAETPPRAKRKEVPTLREWFWGEVEPAMDAEPQGRFWTEWVQVHNKPSEQEAKKSIYRHHLGPALGDVRLDEINVGRIAALRAGLLRKTLSRKSVNNVLCVLSKALRYAVDVELIEKAPKLGLLKCERPEIETW